MKRRRSALFAWTLLAAIIVMAIAKLVDGLAASRIAPVDGVLYLVVAVFALVGALIISRQPSNTIGWLLMLPPIAGVIPADVYIASFPSTPEHASLLLLLALWFTGVNWLLLIFPILFIAQLFPTGRPLPGRWRWLTYYGLAMAAFLMLFGAFQAQMGPTSDQDVMLWSVANPIGFLTESEFPMGVWLVLLSILAVASFAELVVRFRRAGAAERAQIKWLLYAATLFIVVYIPALAINEGPSPPLLDILFTASLAFLPIGIAIAILRYRLWDIEVIIRKTLIYGSLTAVLVAIYFGSVAALGSAFRALTGQQSPLGVVMSTLILAALFTPLRRILQRFIDRRFYRRKYDSQEALADFARSAQEEVDINLLTEALLQTVDDSLQPAQATIWLRGPQPQ